MTESFKTKAGELINEVKGENVGITAVKYLVDILVFCKKIDETFKFPIPKKDVVKNWTIDDWCEYIDLTWSKHGSSKNTFDA